MSNAGRVLCPSQNGFLPFTQGPGLAAGDLTIQIPLGTQAGGTPDNTTAGVASWTNSLGMAVQVRAMRLVIVTPAAAGATITAGKAANGGSLPSSAYTSTLAVTAAGVRNIWGFSSASVAGEVIRLQPGEAVTVSRDGGDVTALRGFLVLTLVPLSAVRN
jgi:hypothetical protein